MANINVVVDRPISDGYKLKFRTPCDSATIEGLEVKYPANNGVGTLIKKFVFKDAHGTELSGVGNLFVSGVMIEVLLDVTHSVAYIKNADTNSYVESVKGEVQRLEEAQRQFLGVAGKAVKECERATKHAYAAVDTWAGTKEEFAELPETVENCLYLFTDDTTKEDLETAIKENKTAIEENGTAIKENASNIEILRCGWDEHDVRITENTSDIERNASDIQSLKDVSDGVADYIVECGTYGEFGTICAWTYRKWNSGFYECYCDDTFGIEYLRAGNSAHQEFVFPITFVGMPMVNVQVFCRSQVGKLHHYVSELNSDRVTVNLVNGDTIDLVPSGVNIHAVGKWK